jgi:hypothetical protein
MAKIIPITEHFQHFLSELQESFWGDLYGQKHGRSFSNCNRSGNATGLRVGAAMSAAGGKHVAIATATPSGIL